jgi:deoxyribose-phosphate aldolase
MSNSNQLHLTVKNILTKKPILGWAFFLNLKMEIPKRNELIQFIDFTSLNAQDTNLDIFALTEKTKRLVQHGFPIAAICVYPNLAKVVKNNLTGFSIPCAVVSAVFPASQSFREVKLLETKMALADGADEIDIVLNLGEFFAGQYENCIDEIRAIKLLMGSKKLKVILETGIMKSQKDVAKAAEIAIAGGADFIKTSTGKVTIGATLEAVQTICQVIKRHEVQTNNKIGVKVSGGVRSYQDAVTYYQLIARELGAAYLNPNLFRIGASSLLDDLITI